MAFLHPSSNILKIKHTKEFVVVLFEKEYCDLFDTMVRWHGRFRVLGLLGRITEDIQKFIRVDEFNLVNSLIMIAQ